MANELEWTTINADGDGNVDNLPGPASTSYQPQNTLSETIRNGIDSIVVEQGDGTVEVKISGPVDENGLLYNVKTAFSINVSGSTTTKYLVLKNGTTIQQKTIATTTEAPVFVPEKNGWYTAANERVLNTCVLGEALVGLQPFNKSSQSFINAKWHYLEAARWRDVRYEVLRSAPVYSANINTGDGVSVEEVTADTGIYSHSEYCLLIGGVTVNSSVIVWKKYFDESKDDESIGSSLPGAVGVSMIADDTVVLFVGGIVRKYAGFSTTLLEEITLADTEAVGIDFDPDGNLFSCSILSNLVTKYGGFSSTIVDTIPIDNPADICIIQDRMIVSSVAQTDYQEGKYYIVDIASKVIMSRYGRVLGDYSWGIAVTISSGTDDKNNIGDDCIVTAWGQGISLRY